MTTDNEPSLPRIAAERGCAACASEDSDDEAARLAAGVARLRRALDQAETRFDNGEIAAARDALRALANRLRDNGHWHHDKIGLRSVIALLWEADRYAGRRDLESGGQTSSLTGRKR